MSGESDIPSDILATASKYARDLREWAAHGNTMTVYHDNDEHAFADTIARAIMAERERAVETLTKLREAYEAMALIWVDDLSWASGAAALDDAVDLLKHECERATP